MTDFLHCYFFLPCRGYENLNFLISCRYLDQNKKMDSRYRRYASSIPKYLVDRPRHFVSHCVETLSVVRSADSIGALFLADGLFSVESFSVGNGQSYQVDFGDEHRMPSCSCVSWKKTAYICKHFFAVFTKFPAWQWDALSGLYKNSPFLCIHRLDDCQSPSADQINQEHTDLAGEVYDLNPSSTSAPTVSGSTVAMFRQLLDKLKGLSYLVESDSVIGDAFSQARAMEDTLSSGIPSERGIPLLPVSSTLKARSSCFMRPIPVLKRKRPSSGRVGERSEKFAKASTIHIPDSSRATAASVVEEHVVEDMNLVE